MAVNAIHNPLLPHFEVLFADFAVRGDIFPGFILIVGVIDDRNDLPAFVRRDIANLRSVVDVLSMNAHRTGTLLRIGLLAPFETSRHEEFSTVVNSHFYFWSASGTRKMRGV